MHQDKQGKSRTIMHVDMDAFFASIEQRDNPELRGKPVIVGGRRDSKRGVVSTCSYEARAFGVHSAMPIAQAARLCPQAYFLPGRMDVYRAVSQEIHQIFHEFSPVVESVSVDEAFLDMTGCEHFYPSLEEMGQTIKRRIAAKTKLTASVGIASNKLLAKIASDLRKPDGLVVIRPEEVDKYLLPLSIRKIWGVGEKTAEILSRYGVKTVADMRRLSPEWLQSILGKHGLHLYQLCRGIDHREVIGTPEAAQSIGHEITFETDLSSMDECRKALAQLAADVGWRLRRHGLFGKTVTVKARYSNFSTITRARTLTRSFHDDRTIAETAWQLFKESVPPGKFRLLGIYVSNLEEHQQLDLFHQEDRLTETLDKINLKYGKAIVKRGILE